VARKVLKFEELIAWQKAMDLAVKAYEICRLPKLQRDFALVDQLHRCAISVPSNIAEGFERGTKTEFRRFLSIAKASCGELRTQIHLAHRIGYLDDTTARALLQQAEEVSKVTAGLRTSVAKQQALAAR
jgi:four helix bundle protein